MNVIKFKHRSNVTDDHQTKRLRTASKTVTPDFKSLQNKKKNEHAKNTLINTFMLINN